MEFGKSLIADFEGCDSGTQEKMRLEKSEGEPRITTIPLIRERKSIISSQRSYSRM
jgi:hypothetical protein